MSPAQASHELDSLTPVEQIAWAHEPPPPPPPPHVSPQTELTSPTQIESHAVLQQ